MKFQWGLAVAIFAGLIFINGAHAAPIDVLVGDKDGFGFTPPCPDVGSCAGMNNPVIDNRDAAEMAATNGAQITDEYSSVFPPNFSPPGSTSTADVIFPFTDTLISGTISFAGGDFQSDVFGALLANINGDPVDFFFADGRFVTTIHSFALNATELAAANAVHQVVLHVDRNGSGDFIDFDWFELVGTTTAVPEPASLTILGTALIGLAPMLRRRRKIG